MAFLFPIFGGIALDAAKDFVVGRVAKAMDKAPSIPVKGNKARIGAEDFVAEINADPDVEIVRVKSGWFSKINWAAGAMLVFALSDFIGRPVPANLRDAIAKAVETLVPIAIIVIRTWFTTSVTKASAGK